MFWQAGVAFTEFKCERVQEENCGVWVLGEKGKTEVLFLFSPLQIHKVPPPGPLRPGIVQMQTG